jgi:hypothetical protein
MHFDMILTGSDDLPGYLPQSMAAERTAFMLYRSPIAAPP